MLYLRLLLPLLPLVMLSGCAWRMYSDKQQLLNAAERAEDAGRPSRAARLRYEALDADDRPKVELYGISAEKKEPQRDYTLEIPPLPEKEK